MQIANTSSTRQWIKFSLLILLVSVACLGYIQRVNATEIYKSIDENGNAVFSDQPPTPGSEPITLPEPNIVTSVPARPSIPRNINRQSGVDLAFRMLSPNDEETFWGTALSVDASFAVLPEMTSGMSIVIYIDGQREVAINGTTTTLSEIDRGTHTIWAELLDSRENVLAETESRTFFMKQFSRNFNN